MTELFDEWFTLNEENQVIWKKAGIGVPLGSPAGLTLCKNGYYYVWLRYKRYPLHRVIFYLYYGYLPTFVDHVDCNRTNNNPENLRAADPKKNMMNTTPRKGCASKFKGVARKRDKWRAYVTKDGNTYNLGVFFKETEAALAYNKKAVELFGEFAKLNEI